MFDNKIDQIEYKKSKYSLYSVLCALFFFLYFIRDVLGIGIPIYLIYAILYATIELSKYITEVSYYEQKGYTEHP